MAEENSETSPFASLPEGCIATIISFTSPKDACRAAAVSLDFKSAAESDTVWERFLPPDYKEIVSAISPAISPTKKELYFLLSDSPVLLNGGKLSLRLSRSSGKKCYMLCARELGITWKDTPMYWDWISLPESRFAEVAELLRVCWLDIMGTFEAQMLSPKTNYAAYLVFKLSENHYGLETSANASVKFIKEDTTEIQVVETSNVFIVPPTTQRRVIGRRRWALVPSINYDGPPRTDGPRPVNRTDGWLEIELGEFLVGEGEKCDVEVRVFETQRLNWKKGLIVEGIELRPKEA